eukprot:6214314-Pleurochrysis_carterae.AAC.2
MDSVNDISRVVCGRTFDDTSSSSRLSPPALPTFLFERHTWTRVEEESKIGSYLETYMLHASFKVYGQCDSL